MSWLVSLVLAGMMLTSQSNLPIQANNNYIETNKTQIVQLDETERFEQTYPLNANGKVSVSNVNGSITIEAWDRNEVKLVAVKTADTREHLQDVQIQIESRPDSLSIETDMDSLRRRNDGQPNRYGKLEVTYQLTVPRTAVLDEIEAVNGSVTVSNMTNFTKVSAVNGEVRATNLRGTASLETVNGTVEADFTTLQTGSQISLSTVNGRANLLIPSDANATLKADSVNGNIINDFGLPVRKGQYVGRNLYGRVGSGDVKIKLESVNGDLAVRRKQDGKNVNPATNLLNQVSDADSKDDEDFDVKDWSKAKNKAKVSKVKPMVIVPGAVYVPMPEINVDVQKEMEKAQRDIAKAQVKVNTEQLNAQINQAMKEQQGAFARLRDVTFIGAPAIEKKSESFGVKGVPKVTVDAKNCSVYVRGWDKSEVQYSVTKFSRGANSAAPLNIKVEHTDSQVNITVPESNDNLPPNVRFLNDSTRMRIEVFVPKKSNLRIHTEGEIRLENVSGNIDLQGTDEAVNVRDSDGTLKIATTDGRIRVIGFEGVIDARSVDGMMNLEGSFQDFNARTDDGTIVLTLPANVNAVFRADTDADIQGEGLNLIRENEDTNVWRIGSGGTTYRLNARDGKIIIRNSNTMATVWQ